MSVTRVISFTSGKGGVGKSNTVINTAIALAKQGSRVLLLDADLGLANINVLLGLRVKNTLHQVLAGEKRIEEIMIEGPEGISVIPAASGVEEICTLDTAQRMSLMEAVEDVAYDFDYLLLDTQAGIGSEVLYFNNAASEIIVIVNPEPTSLTDSYALMKVMSANYGEKDFSVVVNNATSSSEAEACFKKLSQAVEKFLHLDPKYLGFIPSDRSINAAVNSQKAVMELYPSSSAGLAYANLARTIEKDFEYTRVKGGMQMFFRQLLEAGAYGA